MQPMASKISKTGRIATAPPNNGDSGLRQIDALKPERRILEIWRIRPSGPLPSFGLVHFTDFRGNAKDSVEIRCEEL